MSVSKSKKIALIALVWAVAAFLCVLPSLWPWYHHLIAAPLYQAYELEATGIITGWTTKSILDKRRRSASPLC